MKRPTHGGRRKGAGRPATGRVAWTVRVMPATRADLREASRIAGVPPGQLVERMVDRITWW